jgi:hypothetical protein
VLDLDSVSRCKKKATKVTKKAVGTVSDTLQETSTNNKSTSLGSTSS